MKKEITEIVCSLESDEKEFPPQNIMEFNEWLSGKIKQIPSEYAHNAKILITGTSYYDDLFGAIQIIYNRLESDEEERARILAEQELAERSANFERARKYAEYVKLKEFFEGGEK